MFRKVLRHTKPIFLEYKWYFFAAMVFYALGIFFDFILKGYFLKQIIDIVSVSNVERTDVAQSLLHILFLLSVSFSLAFIFSRIANWSYRYFGVRTMKRSYEYAFDKITNHSYSFFAGHFTGGLVNKSKRFAHGLKSIFHITLTTFWTTFVFFISAFVVLYLEIPKVALLLFAWCFVYLIIMFWLVRIYIPHGSKRASADSKVGSRLSDVFTNIFALKVFVARKDEISSFSKVVEEEAVYRNKAWYIGNVQKAIKSALMLTFQIVILYVVIRMWLHGEISAGDFVLAQSYVISLLGRLWDIDEGLSSFVESVNDVEESVEIFEVKPEVEDPINPEISRINKGKIDFKNVSFMYGNGKNVLSDFNLTINEGEKIGIVGHSGSGKSTFTKLLLRFLDVSAGEVLIDNQNIRNITQDDLRKSVSYVPQDSILFHRSIVENISYGKPNAELNEVIEAAKRAHAHEFIEKLKDGYNTMVGERGVKLSGGERQRIAIARIMLNSAPILVLDEATSSLDSISESYIQEAFLELMKNRTTIVIAHRLATIQKMDRIIVLDHGQIVEEGTHTDLLNKGGFYANLWNRQSGGFLEE